VDGPVLASAIDGAAFEIAMAQTPRDGVPGETFSAEAAAALGLETGDAGAHGGDVAVREIERHPVGVESCAGINFWPAFNHRDIDAPAREVRGQRAAGCAGADDQ